MNRPLAFLVGLAVCLPAFAHRDGEEVENLGHYWYGGSMGGYNDTLENMFLACHSACSGGDCADHGESAPGEWSAKCGVSWITFRQGHCSAGDGYQFNQGTGSCAPDANACQGEGPVEYTAVANPVYVNANDCLWQRTSYSTNPDGTFNVVYDPTGWQWSDHNDWTGFVPTSGSAIPDAPAPAGDDAGDCWPYTGTCTPPGGGEQDQCPMGLTVFITWPFDSPDDPDKMEFCTKRGCEALKTNPGVQVCVGDGTEADDHCGADVQYTGNTCTHGSNPESDTQDDNSQTGGQGSTDNSGVEARLDQVVDALTCDPLLDPSCGQASVPNDAATYEATAQSVYSRISNAPIVNALGGIGTSIPAGACPTAVTDPIELLGNTTLTLDTHCVIWDEFDEVLHGFMLTVWSLIGIGIVFRA